MALVGNGFDIQVMNDYERPSDTRYEAFYHYLRFRNFDERNLIFAEMDKLRKISEGDGGDGNADAKNWSDLEATIGKLLDTGEHSPDEVYTSLRQIQREFSVFLNQVAPPALLDELGADSMRNKWGIKSLQRFIEDLDDDTFPKLEFPKNTNHYDLYNFLFVNFNYTSLLDGYVYLDQEQFDPHPYIHADRNFEFFPNPGGKPDAKSNEQTIWSSYVLTEVIHPHGQQNIPRSLLFGVDAQDTISPGTDDKKTLRKPYWGQNNVRFAGMFEQTDLFIIFGCSLGETDGWWWRRILEALSSPTSSSELIIYWWHPKSNTSPTKRSIRKKFLMAAGYDATSSQYDSITEKIHVVPYHSNTMRTWLKTS